MNTFTRQVVSSFCVGVLACISVSSRPLLAQPNWQQQQQRQQDMQRQQQDQQRQQQQAQQRQQMQDQQRQQMQAQQRQQMQDQQRQQMQAQQRQQMQQQQQTQQRQQMQQQTVEQHRRQLQEQGKLGTVHSGTNKATGAGNSGIAKINRPLTTEEIRRGFTGQVTSDGRALIKFKGRVFTVPASRVSGLSARLAANQNQQKTTKWNARQQEGVKASIQALAGRSAAGGRGTGGNGTVASKASNDNNPLGAQAIVVSARARQGKMLRDDIGFNISPLATDAHSKIGRSGTFLTDKKAIETLVPDFKEGQKKMRITYEQARRIEFHLGLGENSLRDGFKIRKVENINTLGPRSPVTYAGNDKFKGGGQHLPGGHPEMVVDGISSNGDKNVTHTVEVEVVR